MLFTFPKVLKTLSVYVLVGLTTVATANSPSEGDDDILMSLVPIIASTNREPAPEVPFAVTQVTRLAGRWRANWVSDQFVFDDFYRFDPATAVELGSDAGILGESHIDSLFDFQTNAAPAVYISSPAGWTIFDPWGPPDFDLGSVYVFTSFGSSIAAQHFYYNPSTLQLSTGISTPATITQLSSNFKASEKQATTEAERVAAMVADVQRQQVKAKGTLNKSKSMHQEIAERALQQQPFKQ